jgi:hypothetical protein
MMSKGVKRELLMTLWLSIHTSACRMALSNTYQNKVESADTYETKNRDVSSDYITVTKAM